MRILLLTDIPPTHQLTAGLVLDKLVRFLPRGSVACFAVVNPSIEVALTDDLAGMPIHYVDKPKEDGFQRLARWPWIKRSVEWFRGLHDRNVAIPRLVAKAARFGRKHDVDAVWVTLQGQTMAHMAAPLARKLGVPLFTLVWDPISWWLKAHHVEGVSANAARKAFDEAVLGSRAVATASWAMTEEYSRRYRVFSTPVIASHDKSIARAPNTTMRENHLIIGMAGQFYARQEWDQVIIALNACKWRIAEREVFIRVAGHYVPPTDAPEGRVSALGWLSATELVGQMADCDVLYCPYPYAPEMDEVSRLSFPSKLVTYLAAARPVLFHGPESASPGRYIVANEVGVVTLGVQASAIYNSIDRLARDPDLYRRCAENAAVAFQRDFTLERMRETFFDFLRVGPEAAEGEDFPPVDAVDERDPRLRLRRLATAPSEGIVMRLLGLLPQVRFYKKQVAELAAWKDVHVKELSALYNYVRDLTAQIAAARQSRADEIAALEQRAAAAEHEAYRIEMRSRDDVGARDAALTDALRRLREAETAAAASDAQTAAAQREAARADALRREMASEMAALQEEMTSYRSEALDMAEQLRGVIADAAHSAERVSIETLRQAEAELASHRNEASKLAEQLRAAVAEAARSAQSVTSEARRQAEEEIAAHRDESKQLAVRLQSTLAETAGRVAVTREQLEQRERELAAMREKLATAEQQAAGETARAAGAEAAKSELQAKLEGLGAEQQAKLDALNAQLAQTIAAGAELRASLEQARALAASNAAERDAALQKLYNDSLAVNRRAAEFEVEVGLLRQQNELQLARILGKISAIEYEENARALRANNAPLAEANNIGGSLYLDLLEEILTGQFERDATTTGESFDREVRQIGRDRPAHAFTMIGAVRMRNLRTLMETVLASGVPGDFIETGVWRGGACIYMRAILAAWGDETRRVFVADSFQGLPRPNPRLYPVDAGDRHHTYADLIAPLEQVRANFARFGLLDDRVVFLPGWFKDTLPDAPVDRLAVLRLDGDMYESTMEGLESLYDKVSPGGFVIVDDHDLPNCRRAMNDFRDAHGIRDPIEDIDGAGVYWRKGSAAAEMIRLPKR